jgi:N-carbamoylputrescine amidase
VSALAEPVPGPTTDLFCTLARELGMVVIINLFERDGGHTYDSSPVIDADGTLLGLTRMVHITDYPCFHERDYYAPGDTGAPVYDTQAGRLGVAICYDRHFPEYMRALALGGAELVFVPQAGAVDEWPEGLYEGEMRVAAFHNGYARAPTGQDHILLCDLDLDSNEQCHARRLFLNDRRPELYGPWLTAS